MNAHPTERHLVYSTVTRGARPDALAIRVIPIFAPFESLVAHRQPKNPSGARASNSSASA